MYQIQKVDISILLDLRCKDNTFFPLIQVYDIFSTSSVYFFDSIISQKLPKIIQKFELCNKMTQKIAQNLAYIQKKQYLCSRKRIMDYTQSSIKCILHYTNYNDYCIVYYAAIISTSGAVIGINADGNRAGMCV